MFDDLYRQERAASLSQMVQRPAEAPEEAGFWEGLPRAAGLGVMHGGARVAQAVGLAGAVVPMAIDAIAGKDNFGDKSLTEQYFDAYTGTVAPALDYWNLPADGIGKAGEIVHGLAGIALPLAAAGGNPELLMLTQGMGTAADLAKKGVDGQTAASGAMISAFTTGIGMKLPMAGNTLAKSLALGVGGNVGVGVLDRAAMKAMLEHQDYDAVAAQYKPFDTTQMALDAFIGAAFGTLAHVTKAPEAAKGDTPPRKLTPDEQAAVLAMNEVRTRDADTLTRPGDIVAAGAAHDAQNLARMQMDAGQPVSVAHGLGDVIDPPTIEAARQMAIERIKEEVRPELIAEAGNAAEPGAVSRMTTELADIDAQLARMKSDEGFKALAKEGQESGLSRKQAESQARKEVQRRVEALEEQGDRLRGLLEQNRRAAQAAQDLAALDQGRLPERFVAGIDDRAQGIVHAFDRRPIAEGIGTAFGGRQASRGGVQERAPAEQMPSKGSPAPTSETAAGRSNAAQRGAEAMPEIAAASERLAANPDMVVRLDDGVEVRADEALRAADAEIAKATTEAKGFQAAIACALRFGE